MYLEQSGRRALRLRKLQCSFQGVSDDIKMYFDKTLKLLGKLIFPSSVLGGRGSFQTRSTNSLKPFLYLKHPEHYLRALHCPECN